MLIASEPPPPSHSGYPHTFQLFHEDGEHMSEDEKRRFAEAMEHWARTVDSLRARERAGAIVRLEQIEKDRLMQVFLNSALGKHHSYEVRKAIVNGGIRPPQISSSAVCPNE